MKVQRYKSDKNRILKSYGDVIISGQWTELQKLSFWFDAFHSQKWNLSAVKHILRQLDEFNFFTNAVTAAKQSQVIKKKQS